MAQSKTPVRSAIERKKSNNSETVSIPAYDNFSDALVAALEGTRIVITERSERITAIIVIQTLEGCLILTRSKH